jgi:hypothetical protein
MVEKKNRLMSHQKMRERSHREMKNKGTILKMNMRNTILNK